MAKKKKSARSKPVYCSCGKVMCRSDIKLNADMCQECASAAAEDLDREMLGEDYDIFNYSGYFDDHGYFGDK